MDNQGRTTDQAITTFGLKVIDEMLLPKVSGSIPGNRDDIKRLLERKRDRNDFKLLLVQDASRFTRAGQGHGQKLIYDLRAAGILVYFVAEDLLVDSDMAETYAGLLFGAARHAVKMLAYNAVNGSTNSYLADRSPYCKCPPFGLDRLYSDNGTDRHIIRNLPDGTQEQLEPKTFTLIRTFARNTGVGVPQHYIKQKSETIRLVPGDPKSIALVHMIFRLHLIEGWSYHRIAKYLNDIGSPSILGKEWHTGSVRKLLLNPIYVGEGIRGRRKGGVHWTMGKNAPTPSDVTVQDLDAKKRVQVQPNPRDKWIERPQPHLTTFLPEEFRALAIKKIHASLESIADGKLKKPNRDRHLNSSFFLKGHIFSKQGPHPMTGRIGGKAGEYRTYGVARGISAPRTNNMLAPRIPAAPVENAVLEMLWRVVLNRPGLEDAIKQSIAQELGRQKSHPEDDDSLRKELRRKRKQLIVLSEDVSADDDEAFTRKVAAVKAEIRLLEDRVSTAQGTKQAAPVQVDALAQKIAKDLADFAHTIEPPSVPELRRMLDLLVHRIEADLETKQVEVEFAIPSWLGEAVCHRPRVGLDELSAYKPFIEAHPENRVLLGVFRCDGEGRPICYTCRRLNRAA